MRARDADRNDVVEALEAAFVDGQLTADEREERVAAALNAVTIDDLKPLVRDLQNAPEQFRSGVVASVRAAAGAATPRRYGLAALAIAAALAVPFAISALLDRDDDPSVAVAGSSDGDARSEAVEQSTSFVVMWSDVRDELRSGQPANQREGEVPSLMPWQVNVDKVKTLLEVIHNQFDAPYLTGLALRPDYVTFARPLKGTQPRTEDWYLSETGARASEPETEGGRDLALFDTRDLDVDALFRNLDVALTTLGVEDAKLKWIDVEMNSTDQVPIVSIWVGNRFEESAWLETTLDGRVFTTWPFTG